jgi:hypothetical protein
VNLGIVDTQFTDIYLSNASGYVAGSTEFREAPEITGNIGIQHDADLSNGGTFITRFDYTYTDQYWRASDPPLRTGFNPSIPPGFNSETGDFGTVNMRLQYTPAEGNWDIARVYPPPLGVDG